jgi:tRNA-dihydrouridine synthase B
MGPFQVGNIKVNPPVLLAPMEDVTNTAFRRIVKRIAAPGLMFTEFVSAMAAHHRPEIAKDKMMIADDERPIGIQIFGGEPGVMAETARLCVEMGADLVDINMGCWVRQGAGAALLKDPDRAEKIVKAVVKAVQVPVTIKVRAGWDYELFAAPELAKRFESAGAQMITLHARFAKQGFEGEADWRLIEALRRAITIPLVGNGDIRTPQQALRMFRETGCDGVMVGRAAISNPWSLRAITETIRGAPLSPPPSQAERIETALEHLRLLIEFETHTSRRRSSNDTEQAVVRMLRGQIALYIKGYPGAAEIRGQLCRSDSVAQTQELLKSFSQRISG